MAGAQHRSGITRDTTRTQEIGAYLVGGILPFLLTVFIMTIGAIAYAIFFGESLNIWLTLIIPVIAGVITTGVWAYYTASES